MFGCVWECLGVFGSVWECLGVFGCVFGCVWQWQWQCLRFMACARTAISCVWMCLGVFGCVWVCLDVCLDCFLKKKHPNTVFSVRTLAGLPRQKMLPKHKLTQC